MGDNPVPASGKTKNIPRKKSRLQFESIYSNTTKSLIVLCVTLCLISLILMITGVLKGHYYTFNNQCPPDFRDHFNFSSKSPAERDRWNHECVKELYNEISCSIWQNTSSHRKVCPHQVVLIPGIVLLGIAWIIAIGGLVYVFIGKKSPPTLKILCYLNFWRNPLYEMIFASRLILLSCVPILAFLMAVAFTDYPCTHSSFKRPIPALLDYGFPVPSERDVKSCASFTTWIYQDGCLVCGLVLAFCGGLMGCSATIHVGDDIRAHNKWRLNSESEEDGEIGASSTVPTVYNDDDKVLLVTSSEEDKDGNAVWKVKSQIIIAI